MTNNQYWNIFPFPFTELPLKLFGAALRVFHPVITFIQLELRGILAVKLRLLS